MAEGFRSFAELLTPALRDAQCDKGDVAVPSDDDVPSAEDAARECGCERTAQAMREAKLFCARVAEAVDMAVHDLLTDIASEVLARELELQPSDVRAVIDRTLARFSADVPVRIRIAPDEAAVALPLPVVRDDALLPGDVIVEFHSGTVDARLGARLARVLASIS